MPFRTTYVLNYKGSGCEAAPKKWSWTVDAQIFTFGPIDSRRLDGMAHVCHEYAKWLIDEFGFHNPSFDTVGAEVDARVSFADSVGLGFYRVRLDVEDVCMAKGDYRFRRLIRYANARMLAESCQPSACTSISCTLKPRVAPDVRMYLFPSVRKFGKPWRRKR